MTGDSNWGSVVTLIHFDGANASTSFHDSSLSAHAIAQSFGGQITTGFAAFGTASADFVTNHGSGPCIRVANSPSADYQFGSGHFTIECWVYPTTSNNAWIIQTGVGGSGVGAWGLAYNSGTPALIFTYSTDGSTNTNISGTCTLTLDAWTHIAADYDGTTLRLYASGSIIASSTLSGALYATTQELAVGNDNHTDSGPWNGYIDEIRVTKGVARYAGAFTAPTAAFPAYGTSPQPELGGAGSGNATNTSITYNVTTWEPNDILVVAVFNENNGTGNPATVASITSSGLSFVQRSAVSATDGGGMEVWWALAATPLIAQSLTIAFTGTYDDASSVAYGVAGCATGAPWDANGSLPATASGFSITGFSTSSSDDCLVTFVGSASGEVNPFGFTVIVTTSDVAGSWGSSITTGYQDVSSTQSSISLAAGTGTFAAFIADALTADVTSIDDSPSITGVAGTGTAASITLGAVAPITGVSATSHVGAGSDQVTIALAGAAGTGQTEAIYPVALTTGVSATSHVGTGSDQVTISLANASGTGQTGAIVAGSSGGVSGVSAYGSVTFVQTALVGDPSWTVTGTWFTDTSTPTSQERIYTATFGSSTNIQAIFTDDQLMVTVQTSSGWGDLGIYASDNSTLMDTVTCSTDTGGALATTTLSGFGGGSHTIYLRKTTNDSLYVVLVSLAWQQSVSSLIAQDGAAPNGIAGTGIAGTIVLTGSTVVPGVIATGAAGVTTIKDGSASAGVSGTGLAGAPQAAFGTSVTLSDVAATGQVGTPAILDEGAVLTGVGAAGQAGASQNEVDVTVNGVETDGQLGTLAVVAGTVITLSDVFGTAQVDTLVIEVDIPGLGIAGIGQADIPVSEFDETASITGAEGDSAAGLAIIVAAPVGVSTSGLLGTFAFQYDANASLPGAEGDTQVGTLIASDANASAVTWNPNALGATASLSLNDLTFTAAVGSGAALTAGVRSTKAHITGKWYFEVTWTGPGLTAFIGLANTGWSVNATVDLGWDNNSLALYVSDATILNGIAIAPSGIGERAGTVYGCAVDFDAKLIWFTATRMRTIAGFNWNNSSSANPVTAVGGTSFSGMNAGPYFIAGEITGLGASPANLVLNTGNSSFVYPIPAGFSQWDNTSFGVAAVGAVGVPITLTTIGGVAGTGMVALAGGHDHRLELFPILANVSVGITGAHATGAGAALGVGFITRGASILLNSAPFVFKGANFYEGYSNPGTFAGLPHMSWQDNLLAIRALGFNSIRLGMFMAGILSPDSNWPLCSTGAGNIFTGGLNADLTGLNTLEFYDIVLDYCATIGLYVLADMHSTMGGIVSGFTSNGQFTLTASPSSWSADGYTDTDYITAWTTIATRWAGKPAFAACDMMNEPWGPGANFTQWGPGAGVDVRDLFTRAGNAIHAAIQTVNPSYRLPLIVCQTHDSDFSAVPTYPLTLTNTNRVAYAPHVYPSPWENGYPASGGVDNGTGAMDGWNAAWGFLVADNTAPVYITEFGGSLSSMFPNQAAYWATLTPYMLGLSGYGGAPTQPVNWSVSNWDQIEGTIVGEDATGILFALTNPATFYTTVVPYLPDLIGSDLLSITGVSGTGGVGVFQIPGSPVIAGVSGIGGVAFGLVSSGIAIQGVVGTAQVPSRRPSFGAVAPEVDVGITGVSGSAAAQTLAQFGVARLTGVSASGSVGTLFGSFIAAVSGIGQVGSLSVQAITSAVGFGQIGAISFALLDTTTVSGVSGVGLIGTISGALFLLSVSASGQVGLEALSIQVNLLGAAGLGRASAAGPVVRSQQPVMMIAQ